MHSAKQILPQLKKLAFIGGSHLEAALIALSEKLSHSLFPNHEDLQGGFDRLAKCIADDWREEEIVNLLNIVFTAERCAEISKFNFDNLIRFASFHANEPDKVEECLKIIPPKGHTILKMYSTAGSQKSVFLSKSDFYQKEIVLKVIKDRHDVDDILSRESLANPLYLKHHHIIQTLIEPNHKGQKFLLEQKMPFVLFDDWESGGIQEAANLLMHMASALKFLHEKGYVHGDIKPDNIGREGDNYVLMDFGLCRTGKAVKEETLHFGSLRTRAPELLINKRAEIPDKIDIWALGATVFNACTGRFPLYKDRTELPPRSSKVEDRRLFEEMLVERAANEWEQLVRLEDIKNDYLRIILGKMLDKNPEKRIGADELCKEVKEKLSSFLRHTNDRQGLSAVQQLKSVIRYLPLEYNYSLLPEHTKELLRNYLTMDPSVLRQTLDKTEMKRLKELAALFNININ